MYYTEAGEFDAAYESFDSTLELDPINEYAVRNRAIALYYGERPQLALEEKTKHYQQDPQDPFRALWLYIIESDIDPTKRVQNWLNAISSTMNSGAGSW